ncbi:MAG: nucleotidyltransferase domain-containing protein [Oscillospiraceae bacterium]|jgi:predicted nucleotidyltransferase|nr:nucleotidyltransferase domain-containing protein [Oscillospiraceae bacterium]
MNKKVENELTMIKDSILQTVPAEAIYLFGSYAKGNAKKDSDLDIYVVIPDTILEHPLDLGLEIRMKLYKRKTMPMDLLIGKSSVFNNRKNSLTLENTIAQEGIKIYG